MRTVINDYWRERLAEGRVFAFGDIRIKDVDYKVMGGGATREWPSRVAKTSLFDDYLRWAGNRGIENTGPIAEFFKQLRPLIFVYGTKNHAARHDVPKQMVGRERILQGREQRYFIKMVPLTVARAAASIKWGNGSAEEYYRAFGEVESYAKLFNAGVEELRSWARVRVGVAPVHY